MTRVRVSQLVWDGENREHIKKHNVTPAEVEEAVENVSAHRKGYADRIVFIGRSGKRILAVLLAPEDGNTYYVVTARDANKKERRLLYENEDEKKTA